VTLAVLDAPPYRKELELRVRQDYLSESPTFQRVSIRDTYPDGRVVVSEGVNKVQDGLLYCVVRKPDDLVIHTGSRPTPDTIIWQRDRSEPLALEWFKETVSSESYTIVGWGYYGSDDPTRAPRTFFHARYVRPKVRPQ
jgi:NADPH-dependent 2,4-dienoyl-CoA reductase/sulfur reductase-like enzyme